MKIHKVCELFRLMHDDEFQGLKADIEANGQREPILTCQGEVIDGRNRLRACEELGIKPRAREWDGKGSLVETILSLNLHRRHLSPSEKAMLGPAVKKLLAIEAKERQRKGASIGGKTSHANGKLEERIPQPSRNPQARDEAAKLLGVNARYIDMAEKLEEEAPELAKEVKNGKMSIPEATRKAFPKEKKAKKKPLSPTATLEKILDYMLGSIIGVRRFGLKYYIRDDSGHTRDRVVLQIDDLTAALAEWRKELLGET